MLTLNVGFTRKSGEANYGSKGASVNLQLELDSGLAADSERLKERIRFLFGLAKASVEEELHGRAGNDHAGNGHVGNDHAGNGHAGDGRTGHERPSGNGSALPSSAESNGRGRAQTSARHRDGTRGATASQARALHAIADRQGVNLADLLRQRYGVDQPERLSITEASELIDSLKNSSPGGGR